jgi:hypothetical protein
LNDLIFHEYGEWFSFDFTNDDLKPPAMSNHTMFCFQGNLFLFDSFDQYYHLNLHSNTQVWNQHSFDHSKVYDPVQKITPVILGDSVYLFGGYVESDQSVSDSMMIISLEFIPKLHVRTESKIHNVPAPRYNYCCAPYKNDILYFGGQNGEKIFNDLYLYNSLLKSFQKIECYGLLPPPLHSSSLINFGSSDFYVHGGHTYNYVESSMYKINLDTSKWTSVVNSEKLNQHSFAGHKAIVLHPHQKNFFIFGGYTDSSESLNEESIRITNFFPLDEENSYDSILQYFSNQLMKKHLTDVSFIVEKQEIKGHKAFLSMRCNYLKELMKNNSIIEITDFKYNSFQTYIQFLYSGEIKIQGNQINELLELGKLSQKHFTFFNEIFKLNLHLNSNLEFYKQLQSDLSLMKNSDLNSDVKVNLIEEDVVIKSYKAHKFILFRSQHFEDAFKSGMKESIENEIDFVGVSETSMETILHYLYSNECNASTQDAVEVLVHCNLFRLEDLAQQCRVLIKLHLNEENILDLAAFSALYHDDYLIEATARFLSKNFDKFDKECLADLPTNFKIVFLEIYSKKVKKEKHQKFLKDRKEFLALTNIQNAIQSNNNCRDSGNHGSKKKIEYESHEDELHVKQRKLKTCAALFKKFNNENVYFE